ncbi:MAG: MBL fold metallo-hydrolase [Spirochaetia bacterium]|nr:MBL fold metallo-hydrolase [Spirochaetia bacterium]
MLDVNCSLIGNLQTKEAFLVDPGGDEDEIYQYIKDQRLNLKAILHTHAHFDHIMGTEPLIKKYYRNQNIPVYLHNDDQFLWENLAFQAQVFNLNLPGNDLKVTHQLHHNEILEICQIKIRVMNTPGHSPGSCSFLISEPFVSTPVLIVGDVIFQGSIGRTDLWKGDYNTLIKSIHENIFSCPDQTRIIPGHGPETTVGEEKMYNPYLAE